MNNRKFIIIAALAALAVIALAVATLLGTGRKAEVVSTPTPSVIPSPTADPFAADKALLLQLSKEFAPKYFTYDRPDSKRYLGSIRPYMTKQFFSDTLRLNSRDKAALAHAVPISSVSESVTVDSVDENNSAVLIKLRTTQSGKTYRQTISLRWVKEGELWHVRAVGIEQSDKGSQNG